MLSYVNKNKIYIKIKIKLNYKKKKLPKFPYCYCFSPLIFLLENKYPLRKLISTFGVPKRDITQKKYI